jgi:transposase
MEEIADKAGVSRATVGTWTKRFREGGIEAVLATAFEQRGRKGMLQTEVKEALKAELAAGRFKRTKEAQEWLRVEHGITAKLATVYSWLGKVGGVLKVPRKTHAKKDAAAALAFRAYPEVCVRVIKKKEDRDDPKKRNETGRRRVDRRVA